MRYKPLEGGRLYIDKTEALEKGITVFPSIYIEGAAASGKTTAIRMLLEKHPEAEYAVFDMEAGMEAEMYQMLREAISEGKSIWIILDNIRNRLPADAIREIRSFLQNCHPDCRLILAGRERPQEELLELF